MGWGAADRGDVGGRCAALDLAPGVGDVDGLFSLIVVVMMGVGSCRKVSGSGL